ncbi:hypothetical protein J2Z69_001714 [Paenibacillus shirakamiensis]|uniref:DUF2500 domain-containing protein n=1 Tax=Paenibacillus shirakamiensis TaxID=1265935 RepID=A0ABS4JG46_9BACL|nr:DUF2500 domain-containing protein [Paenibacillus shirakamiensis]MBP2000683.1 hypothetical protein [Paenibacillus shirakamiensis]
MGMDETGFFEELFQDAPVMALFMIMIFIFVISGFAYVIIKGLYTWNSNNGKELLRESAKLVTKRTEIGSGSEDSTGFTSYFVTYEFTDGRREEFEVSGKVYGLQVEGDQGELSYQGTRFKGFQRQGTSL